VGAGRRRDPDEDLPKDFEAPPRRALHRAAQAAGPGGVFRLPARGDDRGAAVAVKSRIYRDRASTLRLAPGVLVRAVQHGAKLLIM
jgi:hypothetical protein